MSRLGKYVKAPADRKKYRLDYNDWLDTAERIETVSFSAVPSGELHCADWSIDQNGRGVEFFVGGGHTEVTYTVLVVITTSGGQTKEDSVLFLVRANS